MKILLIDADGKDFPNLALMKLSTYHKTRGDEVFFGSSNKSPDRVYISCVFSWNKENALQASTYYPNAEIQYGGSGIDLKTTLPPEVEACRPDPDLYPIDYSLGFATRGCIRNSITCPWCIVPQKEGYIKKGTPLNNFVDLRLKKIILLDNNLLSYPDYKEILNDLISLNKKVCFSQGLDIRLINPENAELLSQIKYYDTGFKHRRLYFAWDHPDIEPFVLSGIETLLNAGIKPKHLCFYVLVCYNTNYEQDLHRVKTLINLGAKPYVMLYNGKKGTYQHHLKRWVEWRYCEVVPWEEYDSGDSQEVIRAESGFPILNQMRRLDVGIPPSVRRQEK